MIREELKLLTDIHDFTTLFCVIFEMQVPRKILRLKTSNVTSNRHHMIHRKVICCANSHALHAYDGSDVNSYCVLLVYFHYSGK